jgi:hypothetical protein
VENEAAAALLTTTIDMLLSVAFGGRSSVRKISLRNRPAHASGRMGLPAAATALLSNLEVIYVAKAI